MDTYENILNNWISVYIIHLGKNRCMYFIVIQKVSFDSGLWSLEFKGRFLPSVKKMPITKLVSITTDCSFQLTRCSLMSDATTLFVAGWSNNNKLLQRPICSFSHCSGKHWTTVLFIVIGWLRKQLMSVSAALKMPEQQPGVAWVFFV